MRNDEDHTFIDPCDSSYLRQATRFHTCLSSISSFYLSLDALLGQPNDKSVSNLYCDWLLERVNFARANHEGL